MIRLATFNVQHGRSASDGRPDAQRLARAVASLDADVIGLQEVDRGQRRSDGADLAREVAAMVGAHYVYVPALAGQVSMPDPAGRRVTWRTFLSRSGVRTASPLVSFWLDRRRARGDEDDDVPGYGIALLSRHPVRAAYRLRLPLAGPWVFGRIQVWRDEPRAALAAVIETPGGPLTVVNTHLSSWRRWNRVQLRWLERRLRRAPRPIVLLGDLNIRGRIPAESTGWRELVQADTYPVAKPYTQIDHVLADGEVEAAAPGRALDLGVSDHRAVVVDVVLGQARA
jgi:endonuclease/exonuclease/phosphatase family metal-dependent hydrolase